MITKLELKEHAGEFGLNEADISTDIENVALNK
jgi:hypothetical protein